ncbi:MAG: hypothetical protein IJR97_09835 [Clostridia bacterium]|nr:hypothetical protein [Clostridia bacterium]
MKAIRRRARRLIPVICFLFLLLAGYGAYTHLAYGGRWFSISSNAYAREQRRNVTAGKIIDRNGVVLAETVDGVRTYQPDETARRAVVHVLGDEAANVANGVESFMSYYLYGFDMSFAERVRLFLAGEKRVGDDITISVDSGLSTFIAKRFPAGKKGAVAVMNYRTGEILALMSFPNFDPAAVTEKLKADSGKPFYNRATQGLYAPGSTFKIITSAAALEHIGDILQKTYNCTGQLMVDARRITDAGSDLEREVYVHHGNIGLERAFQVSCNNTFAQIALELGDERLKREADAAGFDYNFLFRDLVVENSSYPVTNRTDREVAMTGIGQSALQVTPLHMCLIAGAVADRGVMMEPRLLMRAVSAIGIEKASFSPARFRQAFREDTAEALKQYMYNVVSKGTGTAAQVPGHRICGKTGSAEIDGQENTNAWFVGFIDEESAPYCAAVICEDAGGGGAVAAPLAGAIFEYLTR